jgi:hypothetical protein
MFFLNETLSNNSYTIQMKKIILYLFLILVAIEANAQSNVVTSGGTASGSGGTLSYTIGQIDYQTVIGSSGSLSQGVQQPFEIASLETDEYPNIILEMKVFPNPTNAILVLSISEFTSEYLKYMVFDLQGRLILSEKITDIETSISLANQNAATYLLQVSDAGQTLKTFIIIKK